VDGRGRYVERKEKGGRKKGGEGIEWNERRRWRGRRKEGWERKREVKKK
jgi:hypothetical protein